MPPLAVLTSLSSGAAPGDERARVGRQLASARGSLKVWFTEEAIAAWRAEPAAHDPGRAALVLAPLAILTALTRRTVFRLALPQTEGLVRLPSASSGNQLGMLLERPRMRALLRRAPR